jgi:hypothetical protein
LIDRFSADILDPRPNKNKLVDKKVDKTSTKTPTGDKRPNVDIPNAGKVVSIDEWKAILVSTLLNFFLRHLCQGK